MEAIDGFDSALLSRLFQHRVLEMRVARHRLSPEFAQKLRAWSPSGFGVYCSRAVPAEDRPALERLAAYIRRPSFAASRLDYQSDRGQILYRTGKGTLQSLDALDWTARVCSHIPDRNEHQVRYYGEYRMECLSEVCRESECGPDPSITSLTGTVPECSAPASQG